jgi:hypothetical protein
MQKGNSPGAPLYGGVLKIFDAPQNLLAAMAERRAEHPVAWQKDGF